MKITGLQRDFFVIGENIHCTRVLLRKGKRIGPGPEGESILFPGPDGETHYLPIPERMQRSSEYAEGRVKHVQAAINTARAADGPAAATARTYLERLIQLQVTAGVDYLDLNVDEIAYQPERQRAAMRWLVPWVQARTAMPLSIDSSLPEILETGLDACDPEGARPLLNSASLERRDALDLAVAHRAAIVITAAGESGMPQGTDARVEHAERMIELAGAKGIGPGDIHVDLLVFPISVDIASGLHFLDAVRRIRQRYGPAIHITGGMSNVSFGLPARRLVNDVFINLAIEAGADGGILDPVARPIDATVAMDRDSPAWDLARNMLLGQDRNCRAFLRAYRKGELGPA